MFMDLKYLQYRNMIFSSNKILSILKLNPFKNKTPLRIVLYCRNLAEKIAMSQSSFEFLNTGTVSGDYFNRFY